VAGIAEHDGMTELIGWASSVVLLITIGTQIHKQWHSGSSKGVSKWLFVGQLAASAGFTLYSYLIASWIFVITNALMFISAMIGLGIVFYHRRTERGDGRPDGS